VIYHDGLSWFAKWAGSGPCLAWFLQNDNRYYLSGCQVCQQDRLRWNSKLYYLRGHHLTFLNNTENWNQYQTHYTISPIVPPSYKRRQFSNQSPAIILYTCPLPKSFFLCTSFALQIKQTPILAGGHHTRHDEKTNTHAWLLRSKMGKPRKEYPLANQQQEGYRLLAPLLSHEGLGIQAAIDFSALFLSGTSLKIFGKLTQMRGLCWMEVQMKVSQL